MEVVVIVVYIFKNINKLKHLSSWPKKNVMLIFHGINSTPTSDLGLNDVHVYLSQAAEGVHVVEDGNTLALAGGIQDVAVDFEILHHQVHQVGPQLQHNHVRPVGLRPLQRWPRTLLRLQLAPQLTGEEVARLETPGREVRVSYSATM